MDPEFMLSAADARQFPPDRGREVAFAGRSNSGKSTALNCLVGRRKLARTSRTPGRTQLVNFFSLGDECRLVDLPGYGYAKVPELERQRWRALVEAYFRDRRSLAGLVLTIDIRRGIGELDQLMLRWAHRLEVPVLLLLTKADKLSRQQQRRQEDVVVQALDGPAETVVFSSIARIGIDGARRCLDRWLADPPPA
jgi:GTP-binding protein